jgi:uncharacterized membrane protein YkgB
MRMLLNQDIHSLPVLDDKRLVWADRLDSIGRGTLRYGLVALMLLWGASKFTTLEAEGIRPLVEHSPLLSWLYPVFGVQGGSEVIGVIEMSAALLICTRRWKPALAAIGSLLACGTFLITLSFLATTPGIWDPSNPFGGFIMKDLILFGAAVYSSAEALRAWASVPARVHR